jgi:hypothetical protein
MNECVTGSATPIITPVQCATSILTQTSGDGTDPFQTNAPATARLLIVEAWHSFPPKWLCQGKANRGGGDGEEANYPIVSIQASRRCFLRSRSPRATRRS